MNKIELKRQWKLFLNKQPRLKKEIGYQVKKDISQCNNDNFWFMDNNE